MPLTKMQRIEIQEAAKLNYVKKQREKDYRIQLEKNVQKRLEEEKKQRENQVDEKVSEKKGK